VPLHGPNFVEVHDGWIGGAVKKAFSSEVDSGSRKENASKRNLADSV
jgi:hypothetical protein